MAGRKTKLNADLQEKIVELIRQGRARLGKEKRKPENNPAFFYLT